MVKGINNKIKMAVIENYTPYVIELALGMGRIISAILEHNFKARDKQRTYMFRNLVFYYIIEKIFRIKFSKIFNFIKN